MKPRLLLFLAAIALIVAVWSALLLVGQQNRTLDQRVQLVGSQLKCLICQGESVADSPSQLAQQMRLSIRNQVQAGKSDQAIIDSFRRSYGDQIVWSPSWQGFSLLAWLVPIAFLLGGIIFVIVVLREWHAEPSTIERFTNVSGHGETSTDLGDPDLEQFRAQLEAELADDDALFRHTGMEAHQ